jgi:hypothetical protein
VTEEIEVPARPPKKRRQMESPNTLDKWLAVWANDENLTPSERRRAQDERERRKAEAPDPRIVGLLIGEQGVTPQQLDVLRDRCARAEEVHATRTVKLGLAPGVFHMEESLRDVVAAVNEIVAAPAQTYEPEQKIAGVWPEVRYARHRKIPVLVLYPDGTTNEGDA